MTQADQKFCNRLIAYRPEPYNSKDDLAYTICGNPLPCDRQHAEMPKPRRVTCRACKGKGTVWE